MHIVGGGCRNELLNQFTADATGLPVVTGPEEATAVGSIAVQAMGIGLFRHLGDALASMNTAFDIRTYKPHRHDEWDKRYDTFRQLVSKRE